MAVLTVLIFLLIIGGLVVAVPAAIAAVNNNQDRLSVRQKTELVNLRNFKDAIERLAIENQDVHPEFSYQIKDEIRTYELKELN